MIHVHPPLMNARRFRMHSRVARAVAAAVPCRTAILESHQRNWSSASFTGSRHALRIGLPVDCDRITADFCAESLIAREWHIPGETIVDLSAVVERGDGSCVLRVDLLALEAD